MVKGDNEDDEDVDKAAAAMQTKAETATADDSQARVAQMVDRYQTFLNSRSAEETPRFKLLQLFEQDVTDFSEFTGAKLTLAPELTIQRKVGRREVGALPDLAKYSSELTPAEFKSMFPQFAGGGEQGKKKPQKKKQN